jgi:hypothetical protein
VEAARDLVASERLRLGVLLAELHQDRHAALRPLDLEAARISEREVLDLVTSFFVIHWEGGA